MLIISLSFYREHGQPTNCLAYFSLVFVGLMIDPMKEWTKGLDEGVDLVREYKDRMINLHLYSFSIS